MKPLSVERMIEFCAARPDQIESATDFFGVKLGDGQWIRAGLEQGFYQAEVAKIDGQDRYLVVFHISPNNGLCINALSRLADGVAVMAESNVALLDASLKALAMKYGCRFISCLTTRAGLVKALMGVGFEPSGIKLELALN